MKNREEAATIYINTVMREDAGPLQLALAKKDFLAGWDEAYEHLRTDWLTSEAAKEIERVQAVLEITQKALASSEQDNKNLAAKLKVAVETLKFYGAESSWEYTDCGGQYSHNSTIKNDITHNPAIGESGGVEYAGDRARKALNKIRGEK